MLLGRGNRAGMTGRAAGALGWEPVVSRSSRPRTVRRPGRPTSRCRPDTTAPISDRSIAKRQRPAGSGSTRPASAGRWSAGPRTWSTGSGSECVGTPRRFVPASGPAAPRRSFDGRVPADPARSTSPFTEEWRGAERESAAGSTTRARTSGRERLPLGPRWSRGSLAAAPAAVPTFPAEVGGRRGTGSRTAAGRRMWFDGVTIGRDPSTDVGSTATMTRPGPSGARRRPADSDTLARDQRAASVSRLTVTPPCSSISPHTACSLCSQDAAASADITRLGEIPSLCLFRGVA